MGLGFDVVSDQLSAQPHDCRSNSETKTVTKFEKILVLPSSNNIFTVLTLTVIEPSVMLTFPLYERGTQKLIKYN
jgi:hypothetical protein